MWPEGAGRRPRAIAPTGSRSYSSYLALRYGRVIDGYRLVLTARHRTRKRKVTLAALAVSRLPSLRFLGIGTRLLGSLPIVRRKAHLVDELRRSSSTTGAAPLRLLADCLDSTMPTRNCYVGFVYFSFSTSKLDRRYKADERKND